jgi:phosphoenolpyruvate---glycerone phosphotransferase subunit DhaL
MSADSAAVRKWVEAYAAVVSEHRGELTRLDQAIGDGDHGTNLERGMRKAVEKLAGMPEGDVGAQLKAVGMALISSVGGAGGPLYGTLFMQMGQSTAGKEELDAEAFADALEAGVKGVQARGKAEPGDKTMVDALLPAAEALRAAAGEGADLAAALRRAADAAREGRDGRPRRPQGARELPRRALARPSGPGRHLLAPAPRVRRDRPGQLTHPPRRS